MKNKIVRLLMLGFVMWFVPFIVSFGFFDRSGKPNIDYDLFKSIMIVVSSTVGGYAMVRYFKTTTHNFFKEALIAGITWFVINVILDLVILFPMAKMQLPEYFNSIGIRYLQIPIVCVAIGALLERRSTLTTKAV